MWRALLCDYDEQTDVFFATRELAEEYRDRMNDHANELRRTHRGNWHSAHPYWEVEEIEILDSIPAGTPSVVEIGHLRTFPDWTPNCNELSGDFRTGIVARCKALKGHPEGEHDWWVDPKLRARTEPKSDQPGWVRHYIGPADGVAMTTTFEVAVLQA